MKSFFQKLIVFIFIFTLINTQNIFAASYVYDSSNVDNAISYLRELGFSNTELSNINEKKIIKKLDAIKYILRIIDFNGTQKLDIELPYKDIKDLDEASINFIKKAYSLKMISDSENFLANRSLNRIDLVKMTLNFYGIANIPISSEIPVFKDLKKNNENISFISLADTIGFPLERENYFDYNKLVNGKTFLIWLNQIDNFVRDIISDTNSQNQGINIQINSDGQDKNLKEIIDIWDLIQKYNVSTKGDTSLDQLEEGILKGLFEELHNTDPYAYYIPKVELELSNSNSYEGIGASLAINEYKQVYFDSIYPNSPAEKSGIKSGDIIFKVNNKSTENMTTEDVAKLIRGKAGTSVDLTIYRKETNKQFDITIVREKIEIILVDSSVTKYADKYYLYSQIVTFNSDGVIDAFKEHLNQALEGENEISGIIIDLRGNGGGLVSEVVKLLEVFLNKGNKAFSFDYGDGTKEDYIIKSNPITKLPLVVLVDKNSASASEIFALAVKSLERGEIIGTNTYGKNTAQHVLDLTSTTQGEIRFTIALWKGPKGESVANGGLTPDQIIEDPEDQLNAAYEWLNK
jgi:carboxyl-terminal processing protease